MRACGVGIWPIADFVEKDKVALQVLYSQVELPCADQNTQLLPTDCITDQDTIDRILERSSERIISLYIQLGILCEAGDF